MGVVEVDAVEGRRPADLDRLEVLIVVDEGAEPVKGRRRGGGWCGEEIEADSYPSCTLVRPTENVLIQGKSAIQYLKSI